MVAPNVKPDFSSSKGRIVRDECIGVLVDFLTGLLVGVHTIERERLDQNVQGFCGTLQNLQVPLCVLGDEGNFRGEFFPIIKKNFASAPHHSRHTPSAWRSGSFREWVLQQNRKQVVLGGLTLDNCTMLTSLDMLAEGLDVHVIVDVSGAESALVEQAAMARLTQAGAVLHNWVSFACEAMGDWEGQYGKSVGELILTHSPYGAVGVPASNAKQ
jgi:hypothetical protein